MLKLKRLRVLNSLTILTEQVPKLKLHINNNNIQHPFQNVTYFIFFTHFNKTFFLNFKSIKI